MFSVLSYLQQLGKEAKRGFSDLIEIGCMIYPADEDILPLLRSLRSRYKKRVDSFSPKGFISLSTA